MAIIVNEKEHIQGPLSAPVELVVYADFQCPYCRKANYVVKNIQEQLGDELMFVFRNFPLIELHENALRAALAAEAAGKQGKFWKMHDMLFDNQRYLNDASLMKYAQKLNLDISKFEADIESSECLRKVQHDYDNGLQNGVESTPTFFINGKRFEGNWMDEDFVEFLHSFAD